MGERAALRGQVVGVGEVGRAVLQTYGMHTGDGVVGALLQAVLHDERTALVAIAPEAADIMGGFIPIATIITMNNINAAVDGALEDAASDGGSRGLAVADEAAGVVAVLVDGSADDAALDEVFAIGKAHETRRIILVRSDGAGHSQVLDSSTADVAEGGCALSDAGKRSGDGLVVAEEGTAEGTTVFCFFIMTAHTSCNFDVGIQLHVLSAVAVAGNNVLC